MVRPGKKELFNFLILVSMLQQTNCCLFVFVFLYVLFSIHPSLRSPLSFHSIPLPPSPPPPSLNSLPPLPPSPPSLPPQVPASTLPPNKLTYYQTDLQDWCDYTGVELKFPDAFPLRTVTPLRVTLASKCDPELIRVLCESVLFSFCIYRIARFFRGHLFSRISQISASRKNIFGCHAFFA